METLPPFVTFGAIRDEALALAARGWRVVPADLPKVAELGFIATRGGPGEAYRCRLIWRPYGHLLTPSFQLVGDEEGFFDLFEAHLPHGLYKCDDPEGDLIGFVCYCKQREKRSTVFQFPLDLARDLGSIFLDAREVAHHQSLHRLLSDA